MLLPILPSPTRPIFMPFSLCVIESSEQEVRLEEVAVVLRAGLVLRALAGDEHRAGLVRVLRLRERESHELRMHSRESVEQELRLQGDDHVRSGEQGVELLG